MSAITGAITSHDLQGILEAVKANPHQVTERHQGWLPIEWAERSGNSFTMARAARIMGTSFVSLPPQSVLKNYFNAVTATEYEQIRTADAVEMIWDCVFNGKTYKVDRWQRPLLADPDQEKDILYLIDLCNIKSKDELHALVSNA